MGHKIAVIGAGAVGATLAQRILESGIADVVLLDIAEGVARGKSLDLMDAAPIVGHERSILGTSDYSHIRDSEIVVITAGLPRKPGMTREDLISKNASIVKEVARNVKMHAPSSILVTVTNPLDTMTYLAFKETGFKRERIFGMAGVLDGARLITLLASELNVPRASVKTCVMGSHGDTMVTVISRTTVSGKPVTELLPKDVIDRLVKRTCDRGAEIVSLLGTGSAYYSPSAAVFTMICAILNDTKEAFTASICLSGEYGLRDLAIGVPCRIGRGGIEEILKVELSKEEASAFSRSAEAIKGSIELL